MSKASVLCQLRESGVPVPDFIAVPTPLTTESADLVSAFLSGSSGSVFAVRSSAECEDSAKFSYAGQFKTLLNVSSAGVLDAISECAASTGAALEYATAVGDVAGAIDMRVIVQHMIRPDVSGVLFSQNPITGKLEFVIEAAYGLGVLLVEGRCQPDQIIIDDGGNLRDWKVGFQSMMLEAGGQSGILREKQAPLLRQSARKLETSPLFDLVASARRVRDILGYEIDMEWCVADDRVYVLQARPITTAIVATAAVA